MIRHNPDNGQIEKYRHDLDVIRQTASQVVKDFDIFGIEISFCGNEQTAYEELKQQLIPVISNLYLQDFSRFRSLLYRIDVSEEQVNNVMNNYPLSLYAEQFSILILEKEFMKVLYRKLFS